MQTKTMNDVILEVNAKDDKIARFMQHKGKSPAYHNDWRDLMEVVETIGKIEYLDSVLYEPEPEYGQSYQYNFTISPDQCEVMLNSPCDVIAKVETRGSFILMVHEAVSQFVQWYNDNHHLTIWEAVIETNDGQEKVKVGAYDPRVTTPEEEEIDEQIFYWFEYGELLNAEGKYFTDFKLISYTGIEID